MNKTINYYNNNAVSYFEQTAFLKENEQRNNFELSLKRNSNILDLGCGSGRDSLYFIENGHNVVAIDASAELAKIASEYISKDVIVMNAQELNFENEFDAVWASASLLHLTQEDLDIVLEKCAKSLKENGKIFASFKQGNGFSYDEKNRFFQYYTSEQIKKKFEINNLFTNIKISLNSDNLGRNDTTWISLVADISPKLKNNIKLR